MIFLKMDIHFPKQYFPGNLRDSVYTSHKLWKYRSTNTIILFLSILLVVFNVSLYTTFTRSSRPELILTKGIQRICSKFAGEHPWRSVVSIMLLSNFIKIALRHWCFPVHLLHIFWTPFLKNTSRRLLLIDTFRTSQMFMMKLFLRKYITVITVMKVKNSCLWTSSGT